jgi:polyphenol oxidase
VYFWRTTVGPVDLAFTDRDGGAGPAPSGDLDLSIGAGHDPAAAAANLRLVVDDFAPGARVADMSQVHGDTVDVVEDRRTSARPEADALVTTQPDLVLVVRVADCVPVLLADADGGVVAAVHAGRAGLTAGVAPTAVARMRDLGARDVTAWLGPRICGACYEVPGAMQTEVGALVPEAVSTTTWGTPALDIGAGVRAQLEAVGVLVHDVGACTRETETLYSHRRDGARAGRFAGLVRRRADG